MTEFELIQSFCSHQTVKRADVIVETGDDCAVVEVPPGQQVAVTMDTLVAGVHFPHATSAFDIGHKALAVNLSDLAAMGATPAWVTFALTAPTISSGWLQELARGFFALATRYNVQLVGGDLTHGPLTLTLQAQGLVPIGQSIKRSGAKAGDLVFVTHTVGDAGLALAMLQKRISVATQYESLLLSKLNQPEPCILIGEKLRGIASAAIDISDGLAADLTHILEKSRVGARINVDQIPLSNVLREAVSLEMAIALALSAGDDYELCFTVPAQKVKLLETALEKTTYTCIGVITEEPTLNFQFQNGKKYHGHIKGYQHF